MKKKNNFQASEGKTFQASEGKTFCPSEGKTFYPSEGKTFCHSEGKQKKEALIYLLLWIPPSFRFIPAQLHTRSFFVCLWFLFQNNTIINLTAVPISYYYWILQKVRKICHYDENFSVPFRKKNRQNYVGRKKCASNWRNKEENRLYFEKLKNCPPYKTHLRTPLSIFCLKIVKLFCPNFVCKYLP